MTKVLTIDYNGRLLNLSNKTVTSECLTFESPEWKIQISQRDTISFQLNIACKEESDPEGNFDYRCCCLLEKNSVFILRVYDLNTGKETKLIEMPSFFEPAVHAIFQQLQEELLHPFKDKNYLKSFIQNL